MTPPNDMHSSNRQPTMNRGRSTRKQQIRHLFEILKALALCALLFFVAGCEPQSTLEEGPDEVIFFESIGLGHYGETREPIEVVLRDEAAFDEAIQQVQLLADLPDIDFTQTMVALIGVPTESGGYIVEVQSVERSGEEITIHYRLATPGADCITLQALSLPFQVVIIRQTPGNVTFVQETKSYTCGI